MHKAGVDFVEEELYSLYFPPVPLITCTILGFLAILFFWIHTFYSRATELSDREGQEHSIIFCKFTVGPASTRSNL